MKPEGRSVVQRHLGLGLESPPSGCAASLHSPSQGPWDPDPLRPALSLGGQATAWEGSPGRSLCLTKSSACGRLCGAVPWAPLHRPRFHRWVGGRSLLCSRGSPMWLGTRRVTSVVSNSVQPHRWQPTRLLCPWHFQARIPGSPVSGILQARTLEWVAIAFSNA